MMKKTLIPVITALLAGAVFAQDIPRENREGRERGPRERREGRGNRFGGFQRGGAGMMMPQFRDKRAEAEKQLSEKAAEEYSALVKIRRETEEKMQALAKKHSIELPEAEYTRREKRAEFEKKHEKEIAEIKELLKTDPAAAQKKGMELMKKAGIDFPGMKERPAGDKPGASRGGEREKMEALLKEKFPAEYKEAQELKAKNPREANQKLRELHKKLKEMRAEDAARRAQ